MNEQSPQQGNNQWIEIIVVVVLCLSITGYFIGIREDDNHSDFTTHGSSNEMTHASFRPNENWNNHIKNIVISESNETMSKEEALALRSKRRAFAGAPPVVPHPIDQTTSTSCMACHSSGFKTSEISAPQMSHHYLTNCTQCHVEAKNKHSHMFNMFEGLKETTKGTRASQTSPPTIPHSTWMRQNCKSCHGKFSQPGIKTNHPWRTNCTQCHAPSAQLDQRNFKVKDEK